MKNFSFQVVACAGVMVAAGGITSQAEGATNVLRNGVLWEGTFEGDVADLTTSTPAWSPFDRNGAGTESTDGDIYSILSPNAASTVSYSTNTGFSTSTARTIEIRARVPDNTSEAGDGVASVVAGMNGDAYDLRFTSSELRFNDGPNGLVSIPVDTSVFHVYRILVNTAGTPEYSLYIDGALTPAFTSNNIWFNSPGFDGLYFGDISPTGESGRIDVDYISWTDNGAFAPIPEPSTALLGLAGLSLIARRRRA